MTLRIEPSVIPDRATPDLGNRREADGIEAAVGRAFEQMIPFNRVLGLKLEALDPNAPRLRFDMRPELVGNPVSCMVA